MSVVARTALVLRDELADSTLNHGAGEPWASRFFAAAARAIEAPWRIAAGGDLAFPGLPGRRTRSRRVPGP